MGQGPETLSAGDGIEHARKFGVLIECDIGDGYLRQSVQFFGLVWGMRVCEFYAT